MSAVASNNIEMARRLVLKEANIEAEDEVTPAFERIWHDTNIFLVGGDGFLSLLSYWGKSVLHYVSWPCYMRFFRRMDGPHWRLQLMRNTRWWFDSSSIKEPTSKQQTRLLQLPIVIHLMLVFLLLMRKVFIEYLLLLSYYVLEEEWFLLWHDLIIYVSSLVWKDRFVVCSWIE